MPRNPPDAPDSFNPYAPPHSGGADHLETFLPLPGFVAGGPPPPLGSSLSVLHDLTDQDLRRFLELDFFYDPKPLFGFLPQWVVLLAILGAMGGGLACLKSASISTAGAAAVGTATLFAGLLIFAAGHNRRAAIACGWHRGRRYTIDREGLDVDYPAPKDEDPGVTRERARRRATTLAHHPILRNTGLVEGWHAWEEFRGVEFRRAYLIFWQEGRRRLVLPVRVFRSTEEAETFAQAAAGWIERANPG